jgi:hypothetical protein
MNYKEILFFIAKSLTISLEEKNRYEVETILKIKNLDWDDVVKVSTHHYVFPAIYCNLKRASFLKFLPADLVDYMKYITDLNRDRNTLIIEQAQELNSLLLANKITAIFLKGTGNLVAGIYEDIAERMVGDIDIVFSKEDYSKAISVLIKNGYFLVDKTPHKASYRHYPRLINENRIAAVEIHHEISVRKYNKKFNYNFVKKDSQFIRGFTVLSYANKLNLSIIANQINDNGFIYNSMALRNAYDVFLLSKKTNAKDAVNKLNELSNPLNGFLAACFQIFNSVESLQYNKTKKAASYLSIFNNQFFNHIHTKKQSKSNNIFILIKKIFFILFKSITHVEYRDFLFECLTNKNWYNHKLIQFGIKK